MDSCLRSGPLANVPEETAFESECHTGLPQRETRRLSFQNKEIQHSFVISLKTLMGVSAKAHFQQECLLLYQSLDCCPTTLVKDVAVDENY
jgi:hypothetical protein